MAWLYAAQCQEVGWALKPFCWSLKDRRQAQTLKKLAHAGCLGTTGGMLVNFPLL